MTKFQIVLSDDRNSGRGVRGLALYWFLTTFYGRSAVRVCHPSELDRKRSQSAEYLFIGLPSSLTKEQLAKVRFREAVFFDYQDRPEPQWRDDDRDFFLSLTNRYWKPCVQDDWSPALRWGCLPIRRSPKLAAYLRAQHWRSRRPKKEYDVGFLGGPTALKYLDHAELYFQRVEWLLELRRRHPELSFWGGLTLNRYTRESVEKRFGDSAEIAFPRRKVNFFHYFHQLSQCRVALSPAGNARWSYRQYEAVYARAFVVSTDLNKARMLIPLPRESVVMVPDRAPVVPYVLKALERLEHGGDVVDEGIRFLEGYLHFGQYARKKTLILERFLEQLSDAYNAKSWQDSAA